jgi:hypothetical protein
MSNIACVDDGENHDDDGLRTQTNSFVLIYRAGCHSNKVADMYLFEEFPVLISLGSLLFYVNPQFYSVLACG